MAYNLDERIWRKRGVGYLVVSGRDYLGGLSCIGIHAWCLTREEVMEARKVSGDLVFDMRTMEICQGDWWLFEWEKNGTDTYAGGYAKRCQRMMYTLYADDDWRQGWVFADWTDITVRQKWRMTG